jgi:hypothetical protein
VKRSIISSVSAMALGLALAAGVPAIAQEQQLQSSVTEGMAALGMDADVVGTLTTDQVAQIEGVLSSTDDRQEKIARINQIVGNEATATGRLGVRQLTDSVSSGMAQLGVDTSGVDMLTVGELAEIEGVLNTSDDPGVKRARIEEIMGRSQTTSGVGSGSVRQLQDSVKAEMARIGVDNSMVDTLTLSQLGEIENVFSSSDSNDTKRQRIERILAQ